ncbi:hypothetical protein EJD97_011326, partial [Solanum chilense]
MSHDIDVQISKKTSQPLKCKRLKKSISRTLSIIIEKTEKEIKEKEEKEKEEKEKEKIAKEEKEKKTKEDKEREKKTNEEKDKKKKAKQEKEKEKKKKAKEMEKQKEKEKMNSDVKRQYPFGGFNIDGEGPAELISSYSQWINEGPLQASCKKYVDVIFYYLYKKSKQKIQSKYQYTTTSFFFKTYIDNVSEYEDIIVGIMKGFGIPCGLPWHLADNVYVPVNSNGEFDWVLTVVALKEQYIKVYDFMSLNRSNRKLSSEIQNMDTMLPKYLKLSGFFEQNERTNWSVLKCYQGKNKSHSFEVSHVTGIAQQESSS